MGYAIRGYKLRTKGYAPLLSGAGKEAVMETESTPQPGEEMPDEVPSLPPDDSDSTGTDQGEATQGDLQQERSPDESAEEIGE